MNKRGGEKVLSIWWIAILAITGVCIVSGVLMFLSKDIDIRSQEAGIVYIKFSNCLISGDVLSDSFLKSDTNFFNLCSINEDVFKENFYLSMILKNASGQIDKEVKLGNTQLKEQCSITLDENNKVKTSAKDYANCFTNKENVFYYSQGKKYSGEITFLSASNNNGRRISK